jgi:uncharacterized protein YsxB (DUF464 family)
MIRVTIERRATDRLITAFHVKGHAEFAEPGKDIVCAGVSAITVGTVNAIEVLLGIRLSHEADKGLLEVQLPDMNDGKQLEQVQLLLESMVVMLQTIEESYGKYINIKDKLR